MTRPLRGDPRRPWCQAIASYCQFIGEDLRSAKHADAGGLRRLVAHRLAGRRAACPENKRWSLRSGRVMASCRACGRHRAGRQESGGREYATFRVWSLGERSFSPQTPLYLFSVPACRWRRPRQLGSGRRRARGHRPAAHRSAWPPPSLGVGRPARARRPAPPPASLGGRPARAARHPARRPGRRPGGRMVRPPPAGRQPRAPPPSPYHAPLMRPIYVLVICGFREAHIRVFPGENGGFSGFWACATMVYFGTMAVSPAGLSGRKCKWPRRC